MSPKHLVTVLALALPLFHGNALANGDPPAKPALRKPVPRGEDVLARTVFQTLLGEMALQRGDVRLALDAWSDLAQRSRDPKVIARAVEIAGFARQFDRALALSDLWLEVEPDSQRARQTRSSLLVLANRLDELAPQLSVLLEQDKANLGGNLMHLNRMLLRHPDKKAVQQLVDRVSAPYRDLPEGRFAMAQAAATAGDRLRALDEVEQALALRTDWEAAALMRTQLQAEISPEQATATLLEFVGRNPSLRDARMTLARLLVSVRRYEEARAHFNRLLQEHPDSPEIIYPVAILALQQGDGETGRRQLEHLLQTEFPDKSTVHFFLGQLALDRQQADVAARHFGQVTQGEQYLVARSRMAQLLWQQGKPEEARALLRETRSANSSERTQLLLAEAQLLREARQNEEALALIESALARSPDNTELLYEAALLSERLGRHDQLENRLQHLLSVKPDHAHALNALGYSWAERNIRLEEAHTLIARALALAPDDPFIMDSLGWVHFRRGELQLARELLERAHALKADPEIAAHLAEVLWVLNHRDEASRLLREASQQHPDNDVLRNTLRKLQP
ncbi:MAG: tetratricopeptide repeat protein [Azonexus sp.]|nr:tetratricopeptide repeat protein [Azonexus sp.]MCK6411625.1 tetratricopeptide repeat protein [Azonexus sp.]